MTKISFHFTLGAMLVALCVSAAAQHPAKIPRIGWLTGGFLSINTARQQAFREGLRDLGYVEGKNILIEWRGADNKREHRSALAEELVRLKVDVIVTAGSGGTAVVRAATSTIPIVMASDDDPVGNGFVASLARPGGNITGLSQLSPELSGKRLEILKEVIPKLSRVAVFGTSNNPGNPLELKEVEIAAGAMGVKLQYLNVLATKDIEPAFRAAVKGRADAVIEIIAGNIRSTARQELAELAVKHRLPVMRGRPEHVEATELPVEQPKKFEFIINLKAAKQIGLTIPPNVLARADRVIK